MITIDGAHCPTKLPSCLRPPRTSAADAAIALTVKQAEGPVSSLLGRFQVEDRSGYCRARFYSVGEVHVHDIGALEDVTTFGGDPDARAREPLFEGFFLGG